MFRSTSSEPTGHRSHRTRGIVGAAAILLGLALVIPPALRAQTAPDQARAFFRSLVGEWIGVCEQSTDGNQAENKYFHVWIKQSGPDVYTTHFEYYRCDARTGGPVRIGESGVTTTISPDGTVTNKITGKGIMYVNNQPKNQEHQLTETLIPSANGWQGQGSGLLKVHGMPLGLGKNGKIENAKSTWTLADGVLNIRQSLRAGFRAFLFKKSFDFVANYTARHGTDVASLMTAPRRVSYRP